MDRSELIELFNREQRIEVRMPDVRVEEDGRVIRSIALSGEFGFILFSNLDEASADDVIREQVRFFQERGIDFEWKVFDYDRPADLRARLEAYGFEIGEPEALMVLPLDQDHKLLSQPVPAEIRKVTRDKEIDQIMVMEEEVWGEDHSDLGRELKLYLHKYPDYLSIYAAYEGGRPVSAAWSNLHHGSVFASLWGGSTLPVYRARGFYTGLLAARAQEAWQRGYRFLYVDASPMSRPILEKHGFQCLGFSYPCKFTSGTPA